MRNNFSTEQLEKAKTISWQLESLFPGETCGVCACLGIKCYNLSDSRWWYHFLTEFTKEDIEKMVEAYLDGPNSDIAP